jgi:hypothetical protein
MTAAMILAAIAWAVIGAMLWFIFGPLLNDRPVTRALVALFWPIALVAMIAQCFIEALADAVGGRVP